MLSSLFLLWHLLFTTFLFSCCTTLTVFCPQWGHSLFFLVLKWSLLFGKCFIISFSCFWKWSTVDQKCFASSTILFAHMLFARPFACWEMVSSCSEVVISPMFRLLQLVQTFDLLQLVRNIWCAWVSPLFLNLSLDCSIWTRTEVLTFGWRFVVWCVWGCIHIPGDKERLRSLLQSNAVVNIADYRKKKKIRTVLVEPGNTSKPVIPEILPE